ncbi:MAG TPA: hypothetical protein PLK78_08140 [Verrucomicrobiota bacterium]|nr:hypothetical protein [Verrucomicrobiota bacterium]
MEATVARSPALLYRRISWGAIFAGLLVMLVIQLTLTLLGVSIGAATLNPLQERNPAEGLAIGSAIWLLASGLISMFIGAMVAGRLCGGPRRADGLLHGLVTWSAGIMAMIYLAVTTTGAVLGGLGSLVQGAMGQQPEGRSDLSQQGRQMMGAVQEQIQRTFPQAGELLPTGRQGQTGPEGQLTQLAKEDPQLAAAMARMETQGGAEAAPAERDEVVNILVSQHGMEQQQAASLVSQWSRQSQQIQAQAGQEMREAGDAAARGVAAGAFWAFVALVLGGAVAAWGGWAGTASLPSRPEPIGGGL